MFFGTRSFGHRFGNRTGHSDDLNLDGVRQDFPNLDGIRWD